MNRLDLLVDVGGEAGTGLARVLDLVRKQADRGADFDADQDVALGLEDVFIGAGPDPAQAEDGDLGVADVSRLLPGVQAVDNLCWRDSGTSR